MTISYTPITLTELTSATTEGAGVFDVLMRANKAHLEQEFKLGRIKGTEYATVYLGSLQTVLNAALQFTLEREKANLDAQLQVKQIAIAEKEVLIKEQQVLLAQAEQAIAAAKLVNVPKEGALLEAQTAKTLKDVDLADEQIALAQQEILVKQQQVLVAQAEVGISQAKLANIPKEGVVLDKQALDLEAKTALTAQQKLNAITENTVLVAQECKLRGEYDKLVAETGMVVDLRQKTASEKALLDQKTVTEALQGNVTNKQADLLVAQAAAFDKDYQVKMQDLRVKAWATARTTDPDNTPAMSSF